MLNVLITVWYEIFVVWSRWKYVQTFFLFLINYIRRKLSLFLGNIMWTLKSYVMKMYSWETLYIQFANTLLLVWKVGILIVGRDDLSIEHYLRGCRIIMSFIDPFLLRQDIVNTVEILVNMLETYLIDSNIYKMF